MPATTAAIVMVNHDAVADPGFALGNMRAQLDNNAAGFMTSDEMFRTHEGTAVGEQIRAAHARGFDLKDNVARARCWVSKLAQLDLTVTQKSDALHFLIPSV
jgi:hypothetical protein